MICRTCNQEIYASPRGCACTRVRPMTSAIDLDRLRADLAEARAIIAELISYAGIEGYTDRLRAILRQAETVLQKGEL